ncbi:MAG: hypothetical protein U0271_41435 [Polyangiaceae bacterium]
MNEKDPPETPPPNAEIIIGPRPVKFDAAGQPIPHQPIGSPQVPVGPRPVAPPQPTSPQPTAAPRPVSAGPDAAPETQVSPVHVITAKGTETHTQAPGAAIVVVDPKAQSLGPAVPTIAGDPTHANPFAKPPVLHQAVGQSASGSGKLNIKFSPTREQAIGAAILVVAAAIPIWIILSSPSARVAWVGTFFGMFGGLTSLALASIHFLRHQKDKRSFAFSAGSAGIAAVCLLIASISASSWRSEAASIEKSDAIFDPGMKEYTIGEAQHAGRIAGLYGLVALPGFLMGALGLAMVLGERRIAETQARLKRTTSEPATPVWLVLAGASILFVPAFFVDFWAIVRGVDRKDHPRLAKVKLVADAFKEGDMKAACDNLEPILVRDYIPANMLEEQLPGRVELAHRCITRMIDALPTGDACGPASKKLLDTEIVKLAHGQDRVQQACKGR